MAQDWKDMLARLQGEGTLPEGEESAAAEEKPADDTKKGKLHVVMERKGRGGKTATIIEGFMCGDEEVARIAAQLKKRLGCGGSSRGGEILIQGDRRAEVVKYLRESGFKCNNV